MTARGDARRLRLEQSSLYLCTDARESVGDLPQFLQRALFGGVDIVQLRQKGLDARDEIRLAQPFVAACQRAEALFSVNDRADLAVAVDADVLHLGQDDLPVLVARLIVGPDVVIGQSTHTEAQVKSAIEDPNIDYFCVGPVWPTPTKPGRPAPGLPLVKYTAALEPRKPWFAIGGIDATTLPRVVDAGARRAVVVRAITDAADPAHAAAALYTQLG